jgi:hypothetical protein
VIIDEDDYLAHIGTQRHSGRYPWGSGGEPIHSRDFLASVASYKKQGFSDKEIYKTMGITSTEFRARKTIANNERKSDELATYERLKATAMSNVAIGKEMGKSESYIRSLAAPGAKDKVEALHNIADKLKERVAEVKYVDVGSGVENLLAITSTKLGASLAVLKEEGYSVVPVNILQQGTGRETRGKVLVAPGVTQKEAWTHRNEIQQVVRFSDDGGRSVYGLLPHIEVNPNRVAVNHKEDGGDKADGVIYVRPGVPDVSLGKSRYAQVRIGVGNDHYLKGMAMYKEDLPKGVDLVFNTKNPNTGNKLDAMKKIDDRDNPFGAIVHQLKEDDPTKPANKDGSRPQRVISAMNIVNEEGDWFGWSRTIASQMLSKQSHSLAKNQLDQTFEDKKKDLAEILSLTNPTIRKKLLKTFSDSADSSAVHLEAASLPRSRWHAILPINSMPPTQIYAPGYTNGERVALIRFPHGGTFEIPELIVNNKHAESKRLLGDAKDAVGIHHSVAERLSGADFDGDTVLVIPHTGQVKITPALEGLKNFDTHTYKHPPDSGIPKMTKRQKGYEMGMISNLITDMTIRGANTTDLAKAIRHSMVVIDAEKHHLNYKQSAKDNGIRNLKVRYQGKAQGGASTLISRAGSDVRLPDMKERRQSKGGPVDPRTGERVFEPTGKINYKTGTLALTKFNKLSLAKDAHSLVSTAPGTPIERLYADHSNRLKAMANTARLEMINTPRLKYSPSANKTYDAEVKTLNHKLAQVVSNRPLERQAQIFANGTITAKRQANPNMDEEMLKKTKFLALAESRQRVGLKKAEIVIEQNEWNAIQAGAISDSKLDQILNKSDLEVVRKLATPRPKVLMTSAKTSRAKDMFDRGFTRAEVAAQLGVSVSTLDSVSNVTDQ